ncbi:ABC transporter [Pollutimonas subterranea]|uniref:ABC transporter n=1 Tax=Pollutimonas subterranea TaxID=2045210 RepID=A0A2N4UAC5_9BURK|nr:ABC transporter ATP-binding protein [Pollutimonas subterranea]PLC51970.1 ABC transporter [Pollutimonas subterranea]
MQLALDGISKKVGSETWLYDMSLRPQAGAVTVLLGATLAGKTSLMRIMAGLDAPSAGRVLVDDSDVTGKSVRHRNVAMVYQQFINYPSFTVRQNIASPLKLRGEKNIPAQVQALADKLHIGMFLDRLPAELSGGQQQRVALARALAKNAPLMLLDEPLVNLDYKLREELRDELGLLFESGGSTIVYATTEPGEALLLGGYTAVLDRGELLQYGPATDVFNFPASVRVARAFSDPPMNFIKASRSGTGVQLPSGDTLAMALPDSAIAGGADVTVGLRASTLRLQPRDGDLALHGIVQLAEISGSDTFVHLTSDIGDLVAQVTGVHHFDIAAPLALYFDPAMAFVFDTSGKLVYAPQRKH